MAGAAELQAAQDSARAAWSAANAAWAGVWATWAAAASSLVVAAVALILAQRRDTAEKTDKSLSAARGLQHAIRVSVIALSFPADEAQRAAQLSQQLSALNYAVGALDREMDLGLASDLKGVAQHARSSLTFLLDEVKAAAEGGPRPRAAAGVINELKGHYRSLGRWTGRMTLE